MIRLEEQIMSILEFVGLGSLGLGCVLFIYNRIDKKIDTQTKQISEHIDLKVGPIETTLNNHITDTTKKIDKLTDRFDRLYEKLFENKQSLK